MNPAWSYRGSWDLWWVDHTNFVSCKCACTSVLAVVARVLWFSYNSGLQYYIWFTNPANYFSASCAARTVTNKSAKHICICTHWMQVQLAGIHQSVIIPRPVAATSGWAGCEAWAEENDDQGCTRGSSSCCHWQFTARLGWWCNCRYVPCLWTGPPPRTCILLGSHHCSYDHSSTQNAAICEQCTRDLKQLAGSYRCRCFWLPALRVCWLVSLGSRSWERWGLIVNPWPSACVSAGALLYMKPEFNLDATPALEGLVVASTLIGAVASVTVAGPSADWLGRKTMLCVSGVLFSVAALIMSWAPTVYILIMSRILVGSAIGLAATISPILISESAPAEIRGQLATLPQLMGSGGLFLAYVMDFALSLQTTVNWRFMLGILSVPSIMYRGSVATRVSSLACKQGSHVGGQNCSAKSSWQGGCNRCVNLSLPIFMSFLVLMCFLSKRIIQSVLLENFLEHIGGMLTEHSSVH